MNICPICGSIEKNEMGTGDICSCCFNEIGFDDAKMKEEVLVEFCENNSELMYEIAPEIMDYEDEDYLPRDTVNKFLRLIWIQRGCANYDKREKWDKSMGIEQLKNIGIEYDTRMEVLASQVACVDL